jgi:NADH-quinone oxidoreductase subunit C
MVCLLLSRSWWIADVADDTTDTASEPDERREALLAQLSEALGENLLASHLRPHEDLWVRVPVKAWQDTHRTLKSLGFDYFGFVSAIDWSVAPEGRYEDTEFDGGLDEDDESADSASAETGYTGGTSRFQVFSQVQSLTSHLGVIVKADVETEMSIDTIRDIYAGADWHERELHEMFGIDVVGHPWLAPLYLPGEFEGHPLRKDFPLLARQVKPWPGVVDIEDIPEELEAQLEAEVMAAFEANGAAGEGA